MVKNKIIVILICVITVTAVLHAGASVAAGELMMFSDVKSSDWFKPYVDTMSAKGISEGYGNGKYGPQDNLQVDQLIKMVVVGMGYNPETCDTDTYWGCRYIKQAKELGLVKEGEYTDYGRKITRGEIARIIARSMAETFPSNLEDYKNLIKDYSSISSEYQQYVLKVYNKGIVNGYPDGRFGTKDNATRAEASKMIVCLIDPSKRVLPTLDAEVPKTEVIKGYTMPVERTATMDTDSPNSDVTISILHMYPLEKQYAEVESTLSSKFDTALVNEVMNYAKKKQVRFYDLEAKTFKTAGYEIYVDGGGWTTNIIVYKS